MKVSAEESEPERRETIPSTDSEINDLKLRLSFTNYILRRMLWAHCRNASLVGGRMGASLKLEEFKAVLLDELTTGSDRDGLNGVMRELTNTFFDHSENDDPIAELRRLARG